MNEKICSKCHKPWPLAAFYPNKRWKDNLHPWCKTCFNAASKARYEKKCADNPPSYRWHRDSIRHTYFSSVEQPIQAYLLGLLSADGNVISSVPRISIEELSTKDQCLLELMRDELAPGHTIRLRTRKASSTRFGVGESATLAFTSPMMVSDLAGVPGIVPNKTLALRWPSALPSHLAPDFLLENTLMVMAISLRLPSKILPIPYGTLPLALSIFCMTLSLMLKSIQVSPLAGPIPKRGSFLYHPSNW